MDELTEFRIAQARGSMLALKRIGDSIHSKSQDRAPVEEGTLRASGEVTFIVNGARYEGEAAFEQAQGAAIAHAVAGTLHTMNVEVSYNTIYAARQHEELDWHHPLGGQAKYLESVILEDAARYPAIIAGEQRRQLH